MEIEPEMLAMETIVPVYFAVEDEELLSIYEQTRVASTSQGSASAAEGELQQKGGLKGRKLAIIMFLSQVCLRMVGKGFHKILEMQCDLVARAVDPRSPEFCSQLT